MSKRESKLLLADILESVEKIKKYTKGLTYDLFIEKQIIKSSGIKGAGAFYTLS